MNRNALVEIEIKKLEKRRVTCGRWGAIFDYIPIGREQERLNISIRAIYRVFLGFFLLIGAGFLILTWRGLNGIEMNLPLTQIELFIMYTPSVLLWITIPIVVFCEPANSKTIKEFQGFLNENPEFIDISGKWAGRRGFLTTRDTFLIRDSQKRIDA